MKKIFVTVIALVLALSMCLGCDTANNPPESSPLTSTPEASTPQASTPQASTPVASSPQASTPVASTPEASTPGASTPEASDPAASTPEESGAIDPPKSTASLNGVDISEYTIVYAAGALDYTSRAAQYIRDQILARTGAELEIALDNQGKGTFAHEIVVGETNRDISNALDARTDGVEFALLSAGDHIAMEGDYFVIAAAAYYFIETYVPGETFETAVPTETTVCLPIVEDAKNFIFLIGDGMGLYQTQLFDVMSATSQTDYSDGESQFYGYMLPYMGFARTWSLSGLTDSAAAGTALATGYKTINGYIGRDRNLKNVTSLTEIAGSLGMATAVMSTEPQTGATPSSFSAHANNRNDSSVILSSQAALTAKYGTIIKCNFDVYTAFALRTMENAITGTLDELSKNEKGFFLMYEEAHIDKHCHSNDINKTFKALVRFNQAIGLFMEYAFYNPDTFLLITADHETGGLLPNNNGGFSYSHGNHSSHFVPVFTYGDGGELFHDVTIENIQIPKTIASFWGETIIGSNNDKHPALTD